MTDENPTEALSILTDASRGFDTAMRGYDRRQVDAMLARLDDDVRSAAAERDAATARSADLAAQLASSFAQIESLRRQLRTATETVNADNIDARVREQLDSANAEAARIRGDAETYLNQARIGADEAAERIRANARLEAEQIVEAATRRQADADETFRRRIAEADRYRLEITERTEREVAAAREQEQQITTEAATERDLLDAAALAERTRLDTEAEELRTRLDAEALAERTRLDTESAQRRATADEDFEITLRERRKVEQERSAREIKAAQDEVERLKAHRSRIHSDLDGLHASLADVITQTALAREQTDAG